jgi:hypothetical protein
MALRLSFKIESCNVWDRMHSLGWTEVTVDYHCLQIAIACLEADTNDRKDIVH